MLMKFLVAITLSLGAAIFSGTTNAAVDSGPSYDQTLQFIQNRKGNTEFKELSHCRFSYIGGLANGKPHKEFIVSN